MHGLTWIAVFWDVTEAASPWRWRIYNPSKQWKPFTWQCSATTHKFCILSNSMWESHISHV